MSDKITYYSKTVGPYGTTYDGLDNSRITLNGDTSLLVSGYDVIKFGGNGDHLSFAYSDGYDTVTATGTNQTISTSRSSNITVVDHGVGLHLLFGVPGDGMVVKEFQNDPTGRFRLSAPDTTITSDHHGGMMATGFNGAVSVDFEGFHSAEALAARILPPGA